MVILGIDPANVQSAYVLVTDKFEIIDKGKVDNQEMLEIIKRNEYDHLAIEIIANMGAFAGATLFETAEMIGMITLTNSFNGKPITRVKRTDVKKHFKTVTRRKGAKVPNSDSQIRSKLIERFGEVGTKRNQGYFYGFKSDIWQSFALSTYWIDTKLKGEL